MRISSHICAYGKLYIDDCAKAFQNTDCKVAWKIMKYLTAKPNHRHNFHSIIVAY